MQIAQSPVILVLFDGWGYRAERLGNVIAEAETPNYDQLWEAYPHTLMTASGVAVGLSEGTPGSAAAGYAALATGRATEQPSLRIDRAIADGSFFANPVLLEAASAARDGGRNLHLLGLVSDGQINSAERHYFEVLHLLKQAGVPEDRVFVHAVLDGYDTPPRSGMNFLARLAAEMMRTGVGRVATLMGRVYGMASVGGWETTERAYAAMVHGAGRLVPSAIQALQAGYSRGEEDSNLSPSVVLGANGLPVGRVADGDVVLCFNEREEGLERLVRALAQPDLATFAREERPRVSVTTLTEYSYAAELDCAVAFPAEPGSATVAERLAAVGFNIGVACESCMRSHMRRLLGAAPADQVMWRVADSPPLEDVLEHPARVTSEITGAAVELMDSGACGLVIADYVSADLAGHLGDLDAARRAVEALDAALSPLVRTARRVGGTVLLLSCYGNVEELGLPATARANPAHTTNPVPLVLIQDALKGQRIALDPPPTLCDVGATVLGLLGLPVPPEVTGRDLHAALTAAEPTVADDEPVQAPLEIGPLDALAMGISVQRVAEGYYRASAERAADADSAAIYRHLAADESRRLEHLQRRYALLAGDASASPAPVGDAAVPSPTRTLPPLEVLQEAIAEQLEAYRMLTDLAARNVDPQGTAVLEHLANEELDFLGRLQKLSESEAIRVLASLPERARG